MATATKGYIPSKSGSKVPPELQNAFAEVQNRPYKGQAIWFLNGFLKECDPESVWKWSQKFSELDTKKKAEGHDLDEFESHKFLESLGETMTVIQLRQILREIDLDNNNRMSLIEYLAFKYKKSVKEICDAPQGENQEEVERAQRMVDEAQRSLVELQKKLEEQKNALSEQKRAEEEVRKAEEEQKQALLELQRQEKEFKDKCDDLERKTKEGTIVQKNKAVQELAAIKNEDPLPLRRAKINQEAAVRKAEKLVKINEEKTRKLEEITRQVEEATKEAERKFDEAQKNLEELRKKGGTGEGQLWFMQREITEAKKYLPQRKQ